METIQPLNRINIWYPNIKVTKLNSILGKQKHTKKDIALLKDFRYVLLHDTQHCVDNGFFTQLIADGIKPSYILKNKFWLTNINYILSNYRVMEIIDLKGNRLEVTDLDKAIDQADYFRDASHVLTPEDEHRREVIEKNDREKNLYWQDVYLKLCALKNSTFLFLSLYLINIIIAF